MGMRKSTFYYYSTKLYNYLKAEFDKVKSYLEDVLTIDSLIAGDNIEIIKNTDDTITITSTASSGGINLKSLPTFSSKR